MDNTYQFDFTAGEFVMKNGTAVVLEGIAALRMWVEKTLRTQFGRYPIYTTYGANIEDLIIGKSYGIKFTDSELKREITDALTAHSDIDAVENFSVSRAGGVLTLSFTLVTSYGSEGEVYSF